MTIVAIKEALAGRPAEDAEVTVRGWVRTRRDSKAGLSFVHLHDGSCFDPIQVVVPSALSNYESEVRRITAGCSVAATGRLVASPGRGQAYEIQASRLEVIGWVEDPDTYPIAAKRHSFEYLRDYAHLRPRTNTFGALARVRHCLAQAVQRYFHAHGFLWVHTPIITGSDAEGAGDLFRVSTLDLLNLPRTPGGGVDFSPDFFGRQTFLTVSGQMNVEGYCCALSKVYTFGPTFRAEDSNTSRHLAEFWMIEPEVAFADPCACARHSAPVRKSIFRTLPAEPPGDRLCCAHGLRVRGPAGLRGDPASRAGGREGQAVRGPGVLGLRAAVGARALPDRGAVRAAGGGDELPARHQGLLHAAQ